MTSSTPGSKRGSRISFSSLKRRESSAVFLLSEAGGGLNKKFTTFAERTTLHGLKNILSSTSRYDKCFWVMVLITVVVVVSFQIQRLVRNFLDNPTVTSVNVVYPKDGLLFPSLTVCILTKLNQTALKEKYPNMSKLVAEFSIASFFSAYSTSLIDLGYFDYHNVTTEEMQMELDKQLNGKSILDFLKEVSFQCRGQFLLCWFENGIIFDCCNPSAALRVKRHLLHSGSCFEFQAETLKQRLPGPVGGFGFAYWYPNKDLFPSVFNSYDEHAVHLFTSPTEAMLEMNPVVLPVGTHAHISLQAKKITKLATDPLGRPTCVQPHLKYFNYSYSSCQAECLIDNMLQLCNCTGVTTYGKVPQDKLCSPKDSFQCYESLAENFTDILSECRTTHCKEACSYWSYRAAATFGKSFNPAVEEEMVEYWRLPNYSDPKLSLIFADVYFSDIEYQDIQQLSVFNIETFVSSLGGAMGLWTGASIVTWIHLFYFFLVGSWRGNHGSPNNHQNRRNRNNHDKGDKDDEKKLTTTAEISQDCHENETPKSKCISIQTEIEDLDNSSCCDQNSNTELINETSRSKCISIEAGIGYQNVLISLSKFKK